MRDITIGQYYPVDSWVHRLDPRTKLMGTLIYVICLFLIRNPLLYIAALAFVLLSYRAANVPLMFFLRGLKVIVVLLCFTFFFRMVATPGKEIVSFWIFKVTEEGIEKAISLTARIALMITGASLLSYTTTPKEMADGMTRACSPLAKIGLPVHEISVMTMIAFRFIPVLLEEANYLMDAQASRGVEFEDCSIITKCKNVFSLLMPLFLSSVERSADLAMAMEARGYSGDGKTSQMYPLEYSALDRKVYVGMILLLILFIWLRIAGI